MKNYTMNEIARIRPNFFEKGAMRSFNSKINMKQIAKGGLFITSEQFDYNSPRLYTVRFFTLTQNGNSSINQVSTFQEFETLDKAKRYLANVINVFDKIEKSGCYLENEILKNASWVDKEDSIIKIDATIEGERKTLKINTNNWTYTF